MAEIVWRAFDNDDEEFELITVDECRYSATRENAPGLVTDICEKYFTSEMWTELFGEDATVACILVEIVAPKTIDGWYSVDMERVTKAYADRLHGDPRSKK